MIFASRCVWERSLDHAEMYLAPLTGDSNSSKRCRRLHHTVVFSFFTIITFKDLVYGQSSSHWQSLRVSSSRGFFLFYHEPYQPQRINKGGSPFRPLPWAKSLILTAPGVVGTIVVVIIYCPNNSDVNTSQKKTNLVAHRDLKFSKFRFNHAPNSQLKFLDFLSEE